MQITNLLDIILSPLDESIALEIIVDITTHLENGGKIYDSYVKDKFRYAEQMVKEME
jgi:hypothetical protein